MYEVKSMKTSLTPALFIEVPVPSQTSDRSRICVSSVSILPLFQRFCDSDSYVLLFILLPILNT